jgi:hypothetical protein
MLRSIVFLPVHPDLPPRAWKRLEAALADAASAQGGPADLATVRSRGGA